VTLSGIKGIKGRNESEATTGRLSPLEIARRMIARMREDGEAESARAENINPLIPIIPQSPLADYLRTLDGWEPGCGTDLPPSLPFAFPDTHYAPAWVFWWAAIDRRNRQYRQDA